MRKGSVEIPRAGTYYMPLNHTEVPTHPVRECTTNPGIVKSAVQLYCAAYRGMAEREQIHTNDNG